MIAHTLHKISRNLWIGIIILLLVERREGVS